MHSFKHTLTSAINDFQNITNTENWYKLKKKLLLKSKRFMIQKFLNIYELGLIYDIDIKEELGLK